MNLAIIGTGNVGQALAQALRRRGHHVVFGVRQPRPGVAGEATIPAAVGEADATILAVPFAALPDVVAAADGLRGKIVIDATNPLGMGPGGLALTLGHTTSGAEHLAALAPEARVFKTFNQTGFENMADTGAYAEPPVMFVAGDDAAGKEIVLTLVRDAGFDPVDVGGLAMARLLEPLAMLWIELARKQGQGPHFAFTLQRKA